MKQYFAGLTTARDQRKWAEDQKAKVRKEKKPKIIYAIRVGDSRIVWLSPRARAKGTIPCDTVSCPCMELAHFQLALGRLVNVNETVRFRIEEVKR